MPIYEYQCSACGHRLDALQKISDDDLTDCPACHKAGLQKLVSASSFQLKGTGWYATDFRTKNTPEPKKESSSIETKTDTGTSTSSDTKTST